MKKGRILRISYAIPNIHLQFHIKAHIRGNYNNKNIQSNLEFLFGYSIAYDPDTSALSGTVEIYKAGGFWLKIPFNYNDSVQFFRDLYDANWIDRASRLVVIESNFYHESDHFFEALK